MVELLAIPHRGAGPFVFGLSRAAIAGIMGSPEAIEAGKDGLGHREEEWRYEKLQLAVTFTEEDDWKLSGIAAFGANCILNGVRFIGRDIAELHASCRSAGIGDLQLDDDYGECGVCYSCDYLGLMFWAVDGYVTTLNMLPRFDETGNRICWPELTAFPAKLE